MASIRHYLDIIESATKSLTASMIIDALRLHGYNPTIETSNSWSDRHGPSISSYIRVDGKTIRLSDHDYLTPINGVDIRVWEPFGQAMSKISALLGRDLSVDAQPLPSPQIQKPTADDGRVRYLKNKQTLISAGLLQPNEKASAQRVRDLMKKLPR